MYSDIQELFKSDLEAANKAVEQWKLTGLLEGLDEDAARKMGVLLNNTYLQVDRAIDESRCLTITRGFLFPLTRKVCAEILQKYQVDVMMLPASLVEVDGEPKPIVAKTKQLKPTYSFDDDFETFRTIETEVAIVEKLSTELVENISELIEDYQALSKSQGGAGKVSLYVPLVITAMNDNTVAFMCRFAHY